MPNRQRNLLILSSAITLALLCESAQSLPTGGSVSAGSATISNGRTSTTVNQSSQNAVINWKGFDTTRGQSVQFNDPNSQAVTVNRVSGPATIFGGTLNSNGKVLVVNPNGMMITGSGRINANSFVATTSSISDNDAMAGRYNFTPGGGAANATILNAGSITVAQGGLAALVAPNVVNSGTITARAGKIALASGDSFTVDLAGDGLINLQASNAMTSQGISNDRGTLAARDVTITAAQAGNLLDNAINLNGVITATNLTASNESGDLNYGATLNNGQGGSVTLNAYRNITVAPGTQIASQSGPLNVALDANDHNTGSGSIYMADGSGITSNGGNIALGGGGNAQYGYAIGNEAPGTDALGNPVYVNGIYLNGAGLNAGGGNITLNGQAAYIAATDVIDGAGVRITTTPNAQGRLTTSGDGVINVTGLAPDTYGGASIGVEAEGAFIQSEAGTIDIAGYGGRGAISIGSNIVNSSISSTSGGVLINGSSNGGDFSMGQGVNLSAGSIYTDSGFVAIAGGTGTGAYTWNTGVHISGQEITGGGFIAITGYGSDTTPGSTTGVAINNSRITSTATGAYAAPIFISGTGSGGGIVSNRSTFSTVDANVYFFGSGLDFPIVLNEPQLVSTGQGTFNFYPGAILSE